MSTKELIDQPWMDIVPPEPVSAPMEFAVIVFAALSVLIVAGLAAYLFMRPRQRARRCLRRLLRDKDRQQYKSLCFQVSEQLRYAFNKPRLALIRVSESEKAKWEAFVERLTRYRYGSSQPSHEEMDALIAEAYDWLGRVK